MKIRRLIYCLIGGVYLFAGAEMLRAGEPLKLWPDNSSEVQGVDPQHLPTLSLHPGAVAVGKMPAVLICPAGGYKHHSDSREHIRWLNRLGIAAYVQRRESKLCVRHKHASRSRQSRPGAPHF